MITIPAREIERRGVGAVGEALGVSYRVTTARRFERRLIGFRRQPPELAPRLAKVLRALATDPLPPHPRLHPLKIEVEGLDTVGITHSHRLTLPLWIEEREIVLNDSGGGGDVSTSRRIRNPVAATMSHQIGNPVLTRRSRLQPTGEMRSPFQRTWTCERRVSNPVRARRAGITER